MGKAISHQRVPMIHAAAEVLQKQQWRRRGIGVAPATVGELVAVYLNEASGRGQVSDGHFQIMSERIPVMMSSIIFNVNVFDDERHQCMVLVSLLADPEGFLR
ncbi:hypothetical protein [Stenotrophomonas sp. PS02301]|uniref:hypothetical protein n=1 Tax=Stenotrophomonas sp. PS02301 TaxID=2991427 RepID=UPI00249A6AA9|nr:hypothetical protein [Stenotrophomonas sp. PS02301]